MIWTPNTSSKSKTDDQLNFYRSTITVHPVPGLHDLVLKLHRENRRDLFFVVKTALKIVGALLKDFDSALLIT